MDTYGERNHHWMGGRMVDGDGYVLVKRWDHPSHRKNGYILEHRLVMEENLGRALLPSEVVHHRNAIKCDNGIDNLEILSGQSEHMKIERTGKKFPRANAAWFECERCHKQFSRSHYWADFPVRWCSWDCRYVN